MTITLLAQDKRYPYLLSADEGAAANFLGTGGHLLQIGMPNLRPSEIKTIRKAPVKAGFIVDGPLLLWVFTFADIIFDCPFDARLIPPSSRLLPTIENDAQRLLIEIHLVDTATNLLRGLRCVTLSSGLTRAFLSAARDQLGHSDDITAVLAKWQQLPITRLPALAKVRRCGL